MRVKVYRSSIDGSIKPPPSKSYTHRAIAIASLARGESRIYNPLISRDTLATINACKEFGSKIFNDKDRVKIIGYEFNDKDRVIDAENSGTTIRLAMAIAALARGKTILTGDSSLCKRPMQPLIIALRQLGVYCYSLNNGKPPVVVDGGKLRGGNASINGNISSQFISALLIASIYAEHDVMIKVIGEQVSKPYIDATLAVMDRFNARVDNYDYRLYYARRQEYKANDFTIPVDMSSAAILLASGALLGSVKVEGIDISLPQADARIIDILKAMDVDVKVYNNSIEVYAKDRLASNEFNLKDSPDLLPVVSILALKAKHTVIKGVEHARVKETDRIAIIARELSKLGASVKEFNDGLEIHAPDKVKNAILDAHNDHRLFMVFVIASMLADECIVDGLESVDVSYPRFVDDIKSLGAKVEVIG